MNIYKFVLFCFVLVVSTKAQQCDYRSQNGDYNALWYLDPANSQIVRFQISARLLGFGSSLWTGIGFGGKMDNGDFITVSYMYSGLITVADRHGGGYREPIIDGQQDVQNFTGRQENGVIYAEFMRAVVTGDREDWPIVGADGCQDFIFPVGGGAAYGNSIQKHSQTPVVQKICNIYHCQASFGMSGASSVTPANPAGEQKPTTGEAGSHKIDKLCKLLVIMFIAYLHCNQQ